MKILLLGGTGILSSAVCDLALKKGMNVTTVNRGKRKEFLRDQADNIVADIRNESVDLLKEKICFQYYDVVVDFISYTKEQLTKTISIIENSCEQLIFISSATVYKKLDDAHIYIEDDSIDNDKWKYCIEKAECERFLNEGKWSFKFSIVRPYITYGKTRIPFQIVPLKYYTLLNRIKNNKPILFVDKKAICTLTNVNDFAVGVVGLFNNPNAYGEAYHITSNYCYTWKNVFEIIERAIGGDSKAIEIPLSDLSKIHNLGFEIEELYGDKARNMRFDNSKIKNAVKEYQGNISFEEGIKESILFFDNPKHQIIDYIWEGRVDRIINIYSKKHNLYLKSDLKLNKEKISFVNKIKYYIGRYEVLYLPAKWIKGIYR